MHASDYLMLFISFFLLISIVAAPYLQSSGYTVFSKIFYIGFSDACHQLDARSFYIDGFKMAVCSRCFGIYLGIFFGAILYPILPKKNLHPRLLLIFLFPLALDGGTQLLGLRTSNNSLRLFTGLLFGIILPFYINPPLNSVLESVKSFYIGRRRS